MVLQNANNQLFSPFSRLKPANLWDMPGKNTPESFCKTPIFPRLLKQINPNRPKIFFVERLQKAPTAAPYGQQLLPRLRVKLLYNEGRKGCLGDFDTSFRPLSPNSLPRRGERANPGLYSDFGSWIPAFAGMTRWGLLAMEAHQIIRLRSG